MKTVVQKTGLLLVIVALVSFVSCEAVTAPQTAEKKETGAADTTPPTKPTGSVTADATASTSLTLIWPPASDTVTSADNLEYQVEYRVYNQAILASTSRAPAIVENTAFTVAMAYKKASMITKSGTNLTSGVTGLAASTTYEFLVKVRDASLNEVSYTLVNLSTVAAVSPPADTVAPSFPSGTAISATYSGTTMVLRWAAASDNTTSSANLQYKVEKMNPAPTLLASVSSRAVVAAVPQPSYSILKDFTAPSAYGSASDAQGNPLITFSVTSGLSSATSYTFRVTVRDEASLTGGPIEAVLTYSPPAAITTDGVGPVPSSNGATTFLQSSGALAGKISVFWYPASDAVTAAAELEYSVKMVPPGGSSTEYAWALPDTLAKDASNRFYASFTPSGSGDYTFTVSVRDKAGNISIAGTATHLGYVAAPVGPIKPPQLGPGPIQVK